MKHDGHAIALYRETHKLTLEAFGLLFDPPVDKSTVSRWERGRLDARRAINIEAVTGIPRQHLLPELFGAPVEAAE
ncbi:XRE family transcriptional regulator [Ensifer adhaerens]|uniref:helix-turn-helix domain-containing protein n=1 Tax=Ensifer canadensis TaxID=555315 RepID=UPI0014903481|nr:helix-turn-helix transcriptional regulator [Ensifer canadensis]NOV15895.1 XRE family transcriptional regulator [Ensifer canadensis]